MHPVITPRKNSVRLGWAAVFAVLIGCQSGTYQARSLPAKFRAGPQTPTQDINLSVAASPGASSDLLAVGDLLSITVATGREDEVINPVAARIADDGTVEVPVIGSVPVAGLDTFDASENITSLGIQRGMFRHPLVTIEVKEKAVNQITVLGAVKEPGTHELPRGSSDLVSALAAAGGLDEKAGTVVEIIRQPTFGSLAGSTDHDGSRGEVQLAGYRPSAQGTEGKAKSTNGWRGGQTIEIDLANLSANPNVDFRLNDRDVVQIAPRKVEVVHVAGLVHKPGQFELPLDQDIFLLDAIALAGGRSSPVADKIFVIRQIENQPEPLVIEASLSEAKLNGAENLKLVAGDSISLEQTPSTVALEAFTKFFRLTFGVASGTVF